MGEEIRYLGLFDVCNSRSIDKSHVMRYISWFIDGICDGLFDVALKFIDKILGPDSCWPIADSKQLDLLLDLRYR